MINTLSVRSYSHQTKGHSHNFHQIVLPLRGVINIEVENYIGKVTPRECVVIKAYEEHYFNAEERNPGDTIIIGFPFVAIALPMRTDFKWR